MRQAIGYCRVSTKRQAGEGVSLAAQREKIKAWAKLNEHTLLAIHTDAGKSGKRQDNRPALQEALTLACKKKAALVTYSLSRVSRSVQDCCTISGRLSKAGADLVSLSEKLDTTSAAGKMIFHVLSAFGEFERNLDSERILAAMSYVRKQNRRISAVVPFGYRDNGTCVTENGKTKRIIALVPAEQKIIKRMKAQRRRGVSFREIASSLNRRGITPKVGTTWYHSTIRGILRRSDRLAKAA